GQGRAGDRGAAAAVAAVPRPASCAGNASGRSAQRMSIATRAPGAGNFLQRLREPGLLSLAVTVALFVAMSAAGGVLYDGFLSPQVCLNLLIDNADRKSGVEGKSTGT